MNSTDNDIPNLYKLEFERTLRGANIYCDLIQFNKMLCFIHSQREVLHAIELCFKDKNVPTTFKENDWSKALLVSIDTIPTVPPFENLNKHFLKCYLDRLTIIEDWFNKHSISHTDLLAKKQELLNQNKILYFHTHSLRALYETARNNYTFNLPPVQ
tara:strand:+ start:5944 stop:6414 length:471 start_codon:yes stop_codon:yes gene_type:complete